MTWKDSLLEKVFPDWSPMAASSRQTYEKLASSVRAVGDHLWTMVSTNDLQLLTANEAADALRVTPRTVRRWARQGTIPSVRIGDGPSGPVRIPRQGLRHLINARAGGQEIR